ncbi:aspartyl/asparaginyl beta-hydroxylase domain-containing protein [Pedobacter sp. G11]|uniref:aspartyl/asparaginyl beta-hydroxylase domain-containing protein n=1 Tax=Pedobacter sp. G11 TaxID=2482728 RepID=UPI000F5F5B49|nr:aspartyl/asparaginyl beta-hydroxylase domain-containing protein [Pedobacter sp. G11]AZI24181.1 aspartyl/asparaginyl beta-hydroxylase domain-containing protein [Pedobacter sp. G11]
MICFSKLNLNINVQLLQHELKDLLTGNQWMPHYSTTDYTGNWHVLPLRTPGGNSDNPFADLLSHKHFENTALLINLPETSRFLEKFKCEKLSVRLLNLHAGSVIKAHRDIELAFEQGEARLHIPIFTNPEVEFFVAEDRVVMNEGDCWYINANIKHRVTNNGPTDRIHLVIDCKVNKWLTKQIATGMKKTVFLKKDAETTHQVIKSLRMANTTNSDHLADQMEKELQINQLTAKLLDFISEIGLQYQLESITEETFLPGLKLSGGILIVDPEKLLYPGDILHEAGHLACMPPEIRMGMSDSLPINDLNNGGEMMAIAWSYAASVHLGIDPHIVFHDDGYKGGGKNLVENFTQGHFFGVPLLQWNGMTYPSGQEDQLAFPQMINWTCKKNMHINYTKE